MAKENKKCSEYEVIEENEKAPMPQCPNCGGFLSNHFPLDTPFTCKRCGTELMAFPNKDEDTGEDLKTGRLCPISKPTTAKVTFQP